MSDAEQTYETPDQHDALDDVAAPASNRFLAGHAMQRRFVAEALGQGRLHHALLLEGDRGIGKATFAFHVANHVLGQRGPAHDGVLQAPDPSDPAFRQIAQGAHPNLLHVTRPFDTVGKRFRTEITVGEIRKIGSFLNMHASQSGLRVIIIDPVNDLNQNAANALLKMLEEPPSRTHFLLIAHGAGGLLPTIRSRVMRLRFDPLGPADLDAALAHADPSLDATRRAALAHLAVGSVRRALVMARYGGEDLDHALGEVLAQAQFDVTLAHKLGDVAATRGDTTHDDLIHTLLVDRVRAEARLRAQAGDISAANLLAGFEAQLLEDRRIALAYNLNRKHNLLAVLGRAHRLFHAVAA